VVGCTNLVGALVLFARDDRLRQHGVHRELGHPAPELRELAAVVECAEGIQQLQRAHERLAGRRVHELEADEVVDAERLEEEHDRAEVCPLDLRHRVLLELVRERPLRVQAEGLAGAREHCAMDQVMSHDEARDARLTGTTVSEAMPVRGLNEFCLTKPGSMTNTTPSMVIDVSAMLVANTTLRAPSGVGSKILAWRSAGRFA
jgi:hypothetical protein